MDCRDYPAGACEYDQASANVLDQAIYNGDLTATAQIQAEMFNRPPALAIDLLQRTINGQIQGSLDNLHIDPIIGQTEDGRYYDSGQRAVNLTKPDQSVDTVAILQATPPQTFFDRPPVIQPWNFALGVIVGSSQGGGFLPWNQQNHQWQPRFQPLPQDRQPALTGNPSHPVFSAPAAISRIPTGAPAYRQEIQPSTAAPLLMPHPRSTEVHPLIPTPAPITHPQAREPLPLQSVAPPGNSIRPAAPAEQARRATEPVVPQHQLHLNSIPPVNLHPAPPPAEHHEKKPWEK